MKNVGVFRNTAITALALAALVSVPARATSVFVPDGDFQTGSGNGTTGIQLVGSGTDVNIGSGPWTVTYHGLLGPVVNALPPTMTIGSGVASITGIVSGVDVLLNIIDNGGYFSQTIGGAFTNNTLYTLQADVTTGGLLTADVLAAGGAGIGLTSGGALVADTGTSAANLINLQLLSGFQYHLTLSFITGTSGTPTGPLGIRLFDSPNSISAGLLAGVTFDNVTLDATTAPEPGTFALALAGLLMIIVVRRQGRTRALRTRLGIQQ